VFRTDDFLQIATIPVGKLPHGAWPSGDGSRLYAGLENDDGLVAIDTLTNKVIATSPIGQGPQAIAYVSNAVPEGDGLQNLEPPGIAGQATHLELTVPGKLGAKMEQSPTSVSLFDQGLTQVLEASVTGRARLSSFIGTVIEWYDFFMQRSEPVLNIELSFAMIQAHQSVAGGCRGNCRSF
jgi:YVTN family beta-propeller protein